MALDRALTEEATPLLSPGLDVAIAAEARPEAGAESFAVHVSVNGGEGRVTVYLYFDGELVGTWAEAAASYEFRGAEGVPARHALTARAIDATGRWGGASTVLDLTALPG